MRLKALLLLCCVAALPPAASAEQPPTAPFCGSIGVKVGPITGAIAKSLGMIERYGAVFHRPRPGGPAANAGIEAFDVVTAINGAPLKSWRDFSTTISRMAPGTVVDLTTYCNRRLIEVRVALGWSSCAAGSAKHVNRGLRRDDVPPAKP
jgi:membrane-associated protease RseP (regulator of RpoE activity)